MTNYTLYASSGSYTTTGTAARVLYNRVVAATAGAFGSSLAPYQKQGIFYAHDNNILFKSICEDTTITIEVSGTNTPLSVTSTAHDVVIHAATEGSGDCDSSIGDVVNIINNTPSVSMFLYAVVDNWVDPDTLCTAMSEIGVDEALFQYYYVGANVEDNFRNFFQFDTIIKNVHVPFIHKHTTWNASFMIPPERLPWI